MFAKSGALLCAWLRRCPCFYPYQPLHCLLCFGLTLPCLFCCGCRARSFTARPSASGRCGARASTCGLPLRERRSSRGEPARQKHPHGERRVSLVVVVVVVMLCVLCICAVGLCWVGLCGCTPERARPGAPRRVDVLREASRVRRGSAIGPLEGVRISSFFFRHGVRRFITYSTMMQLMVLLG